MWFFMEGMGGSGGLSFPSPYLLPKTDLHGEVQDRF